MSTDSKGSARDILIIYGEEENESDLGMGELKEAWDALLIYIYIYTYVGLRLQDMGIP